MTAPITASALMMMASLFVLTPVGCCLVPLVASPKTVVSLMCLLRARCRSQPLSWSSRAS